MCQNYQGLRNTNIGQQKIKYLADPQDIYFHLYIYISDTKFIALLIN